MKCGAKGDTTCTARQGNQCMEHLITDTPSCPSRVPLTNADRIRAMTDEELAYFLSEITNECEAKTECNQHCYGCDEMLCESDKCLDWLKQEVKE